MKKIISFLIAIMVSTTSIVITADTIQENGESTAIDSISVIMESPAVGKLPSYTADTSDTATTCVTGISWEGDFDENGCFKYGGTYKVSVDVSVKPGLDAIITDWYDTQFTINGCEADFKFRDDSTTSVVMSYTYANLGMPHQDHCFCGGNILLGEHQSHKARIFKPWNGKSTISYTDNEAYVYLTENITRQETFNIPGGKTITLCLNGYTFRKTGGGRVINISSGGKLRLCDCSVMRTGKITGGSHEMGGGIHNGGTFIMYGGKIINNRGVYGGGLWNNYNFYMYGGEICYNNASYGGGLWNANSGDANLIIYGGSIYKNRATYGAGLWNNDNGNITMSGGTFLENVAGQCGGAIWNQGKNFFLEGGNIMKNFARYGAGVWTQSVFTMTGGFISLNEALDPNFINAEDDRDAVAYGGGVWVNDKSLFQMKGGQISLNSADLAGGGVLVNNEAEFVMQGGSIAGNTAKLGGGVYIKRDDAPPGIFRLSGNSEIVENLGTIAGGGMYIQGILEVTGGIVESNFSDSDYPDLAIEPIGEVREGTSLPTEFIDVDGDAYYYQPVLWALEKNITKGTSDITFSPDDKCNLGQILTFLWRAAGSPEVKTKPPIADVSPDDYYYMAAYWGQSHGMFDRALYPNTSCTRLTAVYFIWCAAGKPECKTQLKFTDLSDKQYDKYREAIAWAVEKGITNGTSETTFSPGKSCTRSNIVTFLYRAFS